MQASKARAPATPPTIGRAEEDEEEGGERMSHDAAPFSDVLPSRQSVQADLLVTASLGEYVSAGQLMQLSASVNGP